MRLSAGIVERSQNGQVGALWNSIWKPDRLPSKDNPMKLLLFSDLHTDTAAAARIVNLARDVDVAIGAGDFANLRRGVSICIDILKQIRKPAVLVPGNNESYDELVSACSGWASAHVLHGTGIELAGITFFGIGGGIPITPFGSWSFDFSEEDATQASELLSAARR